MNATPAMKRENRISRDSLLSFFFSLFIHALILFLLCVGVVHFSTKTSTLKKEIPPPPEVIFDLSPSTPQTPSTIRTAAERPLEKPPEHPAFESHENTEASSEMPTTGTTPLPTQEGRESESVELKTSETVGRLIPPTTPAATPQQETSSPTSTSPPTALPASRLPANTVTTPSSPEPLPTATPTNSPPPPVMGTLSSAAKAQSEEAGAHPSVIHGNISNKGKSSVAAEATPLGRYKKNLADAISSHWYYSIDQRMELLSFGTATVIFYVTQNGKVEDLRIISNSSNQTFADCCIQSIMGAKLPMIPPEIAKTLDRGRLEVEYRFTIYP